MSTYSGKKLKLNKKTAWSRSPLPISTYKSPSSSGCKTGCSNCPDNDGVDNCDNDDDDDSSDGC